jgi:AcrR family transcriptional regulator
LENNYDVRRKQIIETALDIIAEKGVNSLTTAEVSKRVGFSEGALFRYFCNKLEIIKAVITHVHAEIFENISLIVQKNSGPLTKLEEILLFQISYLNSTKGAPQIIISNELYLMDEEIRKIISENRQKYIETVVSIIEEGISCGIFRNDLEAKITTEAFLGLIQSTYFAASLNHFNSNPQEQFISICRFWRGCFINPGCPGQQK